MWNHFDNTFDRTHNRVECDNNKMKNFCGASNPNIDKAVQLLQQFECTASDKYLNAKKASAKQPYQDPETQKREANFKQLKELLSDGTIILTAYIDRIVHLYQFEPKKKYVEELEDTSDSDDTDDDNDHSDESDTEHFQNSGVAQYSGVTQQIEGLTLDEACVIQEFLGDVDVFAPVLTSSVIEPVHELSDDKVPCDVCGLRFQPRGLNIHKAKHNRP